jgi:hypothetical protein
MGECYTLVEYQWIQGRSMPPTPGRQIAQVHAALDAPSGEVQVACPFRMVEDRDVPDRNVPFTGAMRSIRHRAPVCPECAEAVGSIG